ncbi:MAG: hypothetical protein JWM72_4729 [Actinomycetia bacterium]|jgi:hypothetical protein|nr:hypothetical protein [Actinomycetes bacterium]
MSWLRRWDEHNQRVFDGVISDKVRQRWRWRREPDGTLRHGGTVLDDRGVHQRRLRRRFWPWSDVAYLTWEATSGGACLVVCVKGDPWVKSLSGVGNWTRSHDACRALLEDARTYVGHNGARVRATTDPAAEMSWVDQPEARRHRDAMLSRCAHTRPTPISADRVPLRRWRRDNLRE